MNKAKYIHTHMTEHKSARKRFHSPMLWERKRENERDAEQREGEGVQIMG